MGNENTTAGLDIEGIAGIKAVLAVCQDKGWFDVVRLLDQSEARATPWGAACTLQVLDNETGAWMACKLDDRGAHSLAHLYRVLRTELKWDGPIRLAVAAE
jgi:hypothetical protein